MMMRRPKRDSNPMCDVTLNSSSLSCTQTDCCAFRRLKRDSNPMCGAQIIVTQLYSTDCCAFRRPKRVSNRIQRMCGTQIIVTQLYSTNCCAFRRPKRVRNPTYDVAFESSSLSCTQTDCCAFKRPKRVTVSNIIQRMCDAKISITQLYSN